MTTKKTSKETNNGPAIKAQKTTPDKEDPVEVDVLSEPKPEPEPPKELTYIEKVEIMSAMAAATKNDSLIASFEALDMGKEIYELFVSAINRKIEEIMSGKEEESRKATDMSSSADNLIRASGDLHRLISGLIQSPLVEVLSMMNKNLGGQNYTPNQQYQQPQQQNNQGPQYIRTDQDMTDHGNREQRIQEMTESYRNDPAASRGGRGGRGSGTGGMW